MPGQGYHPLGDSMSRKGTVEGCRRTAVGMSVPQMLP